MKKSRWNVYYLKIKNQIYTYQSMEECNLNSEFSFENGDRFVIANTFSKCVIELDKIHYDAFIYDEYETIKEDVEILKNQGILVNDKYDEVGYLRQLRSQYAFDNKTATMIICPTLECNFKCPYCYETRKSGYMSQETQQELLFFYKNLLKKGLQHLNVTWYGGEPLLYPDIIEYLSKQMISIAKQYNSDISFSMISNGYCISDNIISIFKEINLKTIQITLDGGPEVHDSRRVLINGLPTFNIIKKNIQKLAKENINVKIRVNLDKSNQNEFNKIKGMFLDCNDNISIYPAIVTKEKNQTDNIRNNCFNAGEEKNIILSNYITFPKDYEQLGSCTIVCSGEHINSFVITPEGKLYKCLNDIGIASKSIGILTNFNLYLDTNYANEYIYRDPFTESECEKCPYLPLCYGACLNEYIKNGKHNCVPNRYFFDEISKGLIND